MFDLRAARELCGLSQFAVARKARISRMRLSQAECGEIELKMTEQDALCNFFLKVLAQRAKVLSDTLTQINSSSSDTA
jgi:transcriptional regulator with XRE-family HTH domain